MEWIKPKKQTLTTHGAALAEKSLDMVLASALPFCIDKFDQK
jgi:hypothetical protein